MLESILFILITGFFMGFGFGPVFFSILQSSLEKGWKSGVIIAFGTGLSETIIATIVFRIFYNQTIPEISYPLKMVGAVSLLIMAALQWRKKEEKQENILSGFTGARLFVKGILLTVSNPLNFLIWSGINFHLKSYSFSKAVEAFHLYGLILIIFLSQMTVIFFSHKIKDRLDEKYSKVFKWILTVVLVLAAAKILVG
ncbi:MAG: L-lysine exporter family protein LysE/ArgO [Arcticibacterium sp.]|jgi:L-lysine exporter family protein LysE/ArgO